MGILLEFFAFPKYLSMCTGEKTKVMLINVIVSISKALQKNAIGTKYVLLRSF